MTLDPALSWVVFDLDGELYGLPAPVIDRVLPRVSVVRLPALGTTVAGAVHIGDEIVPLLSHGRRPAGRDRPVIVLAFPDGRVALEVDAVLGVGLLDAGACWAGRPVQRRQADDFRQQAPARPDAAPFVARRLLRRRAAPAAGAAPRLLLVRSQSIEWAIGAADVLSVHAPTVLTPVPLARQSVLGMTVLQGRAVPVLRLGPGQEVPAALVLVRSSGGAMAIAADRTPGWTLDRGQARLLEADRLWVESGLGTGCEDLDAGAAMVAATCRLLPVVLGPHSYCVRLEQVERVMTACRVIRLPSGGRRHDRLDGAVGVDGRVVPVTDGRRWMGLDEGASGAVQTHLLIRAQSQLHVLAVDRVGRPVVVDRGRLSPVIDPMARLSALVSLPGGTVPVLNVDGLAAARPA